MKTFKKSKNDKNKLVISLGDPAGIGTEITLKALGSNQLNKKIEPLLVGCKNNIYQIYKRLINNGVNNIPDPKTLAIIDLPLEVIAAKTKATEALRSLLINSAPSKFEFP